MRPSRRQAVIAALVVIAVIAALVIWWLVGRSPSGQAGSPASPTPSASTAGPTQQADPTPTSEAGAGSAPDDPEEPAPPAAEPAPSAPGAPAQSGTQVQTTFAGWNAATGAVEVGAYIDAVDSGGRCTLALTGPAGDRTADSTAVPDVTTTSCGNLAVSGSQLSPGTWQAVVTYTSARFAGTSAPLTIEVP